MIGGEKVKHPDRLTTNAFDCVNKIPNLRFALEQNLILSIMHKVFKQVDQRIAKKFNVLATLVNKLKAVTLNKGDIIVKPDSKIDTIYIVYSG